MQKRRTQSENEISAKEEQKTLERFLFQNGGCHIPKSSSRKFRENRGKIQLDWVPSSQTVFVRAKMIPTNSSPIFFFAELKLSF